mgnify:CR=1 FL=1
MQFNSIEFIFEFLPLFLLIYYLIRREFRGVVLLAGSFAFYWLASGDQVWWVAVLAAVTLFSYFASRSLARGRKAWLLGGYLTVLEFWYSSKCMPAAGICLRV